MYIVYRGESDWVFKVLACGMFSILGGVGNTVDHRMVDHYRHADVYGFFCQGHSGLETKVLYFIITTGISIFPGMVDISDRTVT